MDDLTWHSIYMFGYAVSINVVFSRTINRVNRDIALYITPLQLPRLQQKQRSIHFSTIAIFVHRRALHASCSRVDQ